MTDMVTKNFSWKEISCPCCGVFLGDEENVQLLQLLRDKLDIPLIVNSGYRCHSHNASEAVKGRPNSRHLQGDAFDVSTVGLSGWHKYMLIKEALELGFRGIGIAKTFIHLDLRDIGTMWTYDNDA